MAWNQGRRRGGGGGGGGGNIAPTPCPDCGSDMWDNSDTKTNPRAPDYVCKQQSCRKGVWITNTERNAAQGVAQPAGEPAPGASPAQKKLLILDKAMELSLQAAKKLLAAEFATGSSIAPELVVNLATTMYISRTREKAGIFKTEKDALAGAQTRAREAAEAEKKRQEEERARAAAAPQGMPSHGYYPDSPDDDDLPF